MANRDMVVIGGSTGSGAVLKRIMADLPPDLPARILIATHMPTHSPGYLAEMLDRAGPLPVHRAIDGQATEPGHVYVAAPDRHLLVADGTIMLGEGPRENMSRPAIDALFRSAALAHRGRAIGVLLSGQLNDGAAGLFAIKACGGTAIVQHPLDAEADQMPLAALEAVDVDEVASAGELGRRIAACVADQARPDLPPPEGLALEVRIAAGARVGSEALSRIAEPAPLTCPDCHGVLSEVRGERPLRYRCQIGHAFTAESLASRTDEIDQAVHIALRMMEERLTLVRRMQREAMDSGRTAVAELHGARAEEYGHYAEVLRAAASRSLRMREAERQQEI